MPFHFFVLNFVQTGKRAQLRVWNNENIVVNEIEDVTAPVKEVAIAQPKIINSSRLTELALIVDTKGAYKGEQIPEYRNLKKPEEVTIKQLNEMTK